MLSLSHCRPFVAVLGVVLLPLAGCTGGNGHRSVQNGQDLIVSGQSTTVRDSVSGDVILAGANTEFSGAAGGDYLGVGGTQRMAGRVHGSIRAAGGDVHMMGSADRNATIAGGNVTLDSAAMIGGNAYLFAGNVEVNGNVRGGLMASGGTVFLNGVVGRDVEIAAGSLHIGSGAQIAGNLRYKVPKDKVKIDTGARIAGTITALPVSRGPGIRLVLWMLGFVVAGVVVIALFPRFAAETIEILRARPGLSGIVGLCSIFVVAIVVMILVVTFIGLPLAVIAVLVYGIICYLANVPVATWVGRRILGPRAGAGRQGMIVSFLAGGILLVLIELIPVVGAWVATVSALFGIGAILLQARAKHARRLL